MVIKQQIAVEGGIDSKLKPIRSRPEGSLNLDSCVCTQCRTRPMVTDYHFLQFYESVDRLSSSSVKTVVSDMSNYDHYQQRERQKRI
jgi:hypothetical protein